jgi:hypothetical protein
MRYILAFAVLAYFSGCKAFKTVSHATHDSVVVKFRDSVVVKTYKHIKDSTVIKDTLIRVKHDRAEWSFPANSTTDTAIRKGRATLRISVNNGVIKGQADCDSFDIVVNDMRVIIQEKNFENERISKELKEYKAIHSEVTVKEAKKGLFARIWGYLCNLFAWIGLIVVVLWIVRRIFKF